MFLVRAVVRVVGLAEGDMGLGCSFGEADELQRSLLRLAEHLGLVLLVLGVEERNVFGGVAGLELGREVQQVAFVFVVARHLLEEPGRLQPLLARLLRARGHWVVHLTNIY